jgi:hypothetical protein
MIGWSQFITATDAEDIRAYVAQQALILQQSETPSTNATPAGERAPDAL